ncbi:MAG: hypothetical protein FJX48_03205 [Alphaproteobacteria bacterium]|nr:hypothetical protein [Alphaproteobacteria bacterium]
MSVVGLRAGMATLDGLRIPAKVGAMTQPKLKRELETTFVPVVTMEEVPVLNDEEREELIASLRDAESDVAAGRATPFDRAGFIARFMAICRGDLD